MISARWLESAFAWSLVVAATLTASLMITLGLFDDLAELLHSRTRPSQQRR